MEKQVNTATKKTANATKKNGEKKMDTSAPKKTTNETTNETTGEKKMENNAVTVDFAARAARDVISALEGTFTLTLSNKEALHGTAFTAAFNAYCGAASHEEAVRQATAVALASWLLAQ